MEWHEVKISIIIIIIIIIITIIDALLNASASLSPVSVLLFFCFNQWIAMLWLDNPIETFEL